MMNPEALAPTPAEYRDRRTGLIIFGILMALLGGFFLLSVPLMVLALFVSPGKTAVAPTPQAIIPGMIMSAGLAVVFIWLGIGSMLCRRWARAILLILSWTWLVMGIVAMIFLAVLLPQIMSVIDAAQPPGQQPMPREMKAAFMVMQAIFACVMYVLIPGALVLFYRSKHVKATCEARDPVVRWTDRCPLPVLALSLWAALGAAAMLAFPFFYNGIVPFFGMFLSGIMGSAVCVAIALLWAYAARALYRVELAGWWIMLVGMIVLAASAFVTYLRHDLMEVYRLMGYPEAQIAQLRQFNVFHGPMLAWSTLAFAIPFVLYLVFVRKYFTRPFASASR
jgi:MFS family permease